ncbi:MAG: hypothetical protein KKA62_00500 [Nanoarchaeota archaeon]|nr:hypothetical protein [Nanoarchaeota archaeon]MBU1644397.1 hypothetical protein [Nanoarchaeota archaeon]MBU1976416.1 hypothetical protein [Nanoarchaeota archaeon]
MNDKLPKIVGLAALVSALTGCEERWPQYSGLYELQEVSISNPDFLGEKSWPKNLEIVHRMNYQGSGFSHYLRFNFKPSSQSQAEGNLIFKLSELTNINQGVYPNDTPDGDQIYSEKKIDGGAPFCNSQVQYWIFAEFFPRHGLLKDIYPDYDGTIGKDPVTGMSLEITPQDPTKQFNEDTADKWYEIEENNGGLDLKITILRFLDSTTDGCYKWGGYLPPDKWGSSTWSSARYRTEEPDYRINILTAGLSDLGELKELNIRFFKQVIPGVDSTNKY